MERYIIFFDRKTQFCQDTNSSQSNLYIQYNPNQYPKKYFVVIAILFLKFIWRGKGLKIDHMTLKEMDKVGKLTLPDFMSYYTAIVLKTV